MDVVSDEVGVGEDENDGPFIPGSGMAMKILKKWWVNWRSMSLLQLILTRP